MMTGPGVEASSTPEGDDCLSGGVVSVIDGHVLARGAVERKCESEQSPAARPVLRLYRAAVRLDDGAADRQTEANPMRARRSAAVELVEDPLLVDPVEARSPIG